MSMMAAMNQASTDGIFLEKVEKQLLSWLESVDRRVARLTESMRYTLIADGKKIRPIAISRIARIYDVPTDRAVPLAAAVEMIHASSLLVDDLPAMDNAHLRRGKQSNHRVFGEDTAILASFGLLIGASELILDSALFTENEKTGILKLLSDASGVKGMVSGQYADLKNDLKQADESLLDYIHEKKTAALFSAACAGTALLGKAPSSEIMAFHRFAVAIGFAFQVRDDIIDATATSTDAGKDTGIDTFNYVNRLGLGRCRDIVSESMERAKSNLKFLGGKEEDLVEFFEKLLKQ